MQNISAFKYCLCKAGLANVLIIHFKFAVFNGNPYENVKYCNYIYFHILFMYKCKAVFIFDISDNFYLSSIVFLFYEFTHYL